MRTRGIAIVTAAVALTTPLTTGCSKRDPDINGSLGLARDGGRTLVVIHTCHGDVEDIEVSADRQGLSADQTNPSLGSLHARRPVSGDVTVDLRFPGPDWEVRTPVTLPTEPGKGIVVTGRRESTNTELRQADGTMRQLTALRRGQVLTDGGPDKDEARTLSTAQFRSEACSG